MPSRFDQRLGCAWGAPRKKSRLYFLQACLVLTWAGGTDARVEALRHGDLSVLDDGTKAAQL
jgi:hypothetical protein